MKHPKINNEWTDVVIYAIVFFFFIIVGLAFILILTYYD